MADMTIRQRFTLTLYAVTLWPLLVVVGALCLAIAGIAMTVPLVRAIWERNGTNVERDGNGWRFHSPIDLRT